MAQNVLAVIVGLILGSMANMALIMVSATIWEIPPGLDPKDAAGFRAYVETLPPAAFLFAMAAHLSQAIVGGAAAAWLGRSHRVALALVVGALTLAGSVANLVMMPSPAWMWVEVALVPLAAWGAGHAVAVQQRARATPAA